LERIIKLFFGYNRQKTRKNIVQNIGVFVNVLQNQTKLTRIHIYRINKERNYGK